jgi:hypothetical protein
MTWTKEHKIKWIINHPNYNKKYAKRRYNNDPIYRQKCIDSAKKWQKNNKDKFKIIRKRYYNSNAKEICKNKMIWNKSEEGKAWYKNNYKLNGNKIRKNMMEYYFKNAKKWDRYRYKWILSDMDIHEKNFRIAKLFIKRINWITKYKISKKDIKMESNGQANITIRMPNKKYINKLKEASIYWEENFNKYNGSKVNVAVKLKKDIKSSYNTLITVGGKN